MAKPVEVSREVLLDAVHKLGLKEEHGVISSVSVWFDKDMREGAWIVHDEFRKLLRADLADQYVKAGGALHG